MGNYTTKAEVIIDLQERGYDQDFVLDSEGILFLQQGELYRPDEFDVTETYRFEKNQRHSDGDLIYAIRSREKDIRGILMTSVRNLENNISIHLSSKFAADIYR
jgi:hypothetical protein